MFKNKRNGKTYIGQSVNITKRKWEHINSPSNHSKFDLYLRKVGIENFDFIILEECSIAELDEKEQYWIDYYDSIKNGYNLLPGGQNQRGENNIKAKLTETQVLEIIQLLEQHKLSNKQIAGLYFVSPQTIDGINRCLNWTHLHNYTSNIRQENLNLLDKAHSSFAGENCPTAKITEEQAKEIISKLSSPDFQSLAQVSRDLSISIYIISDINRCRTWKYLHNFKYNIRDEAKKLAQSQSIRG